MQTYLPLVVLLELAGVFVRHDDFAGANVVVDGREQVWRKVGASVDAAVVVDKLLERHGLFVLRVVLVHCSGEDKK